MKKLINTIGFFIVIGVFTGAGFLISATAEEEVEKETVDTRPLISVKPLIPENHEVVISGFGEVTPLETTIVAAQVAGEIIDWNPSFVAGGVVKRGDILFTIETDQYEADVLQAEAQVSLAEASLIEELARQKVAQREAKHLPANKVSDLYLRKPQVLSAQAQLKSAQANLKIAQRNLEKTKVVAPYDALVISREIGLGQFVNSGTRVAELNNIESAEVIIPIAGFDRPFLKNDMLDTQAMAIQKGQVNAVRSGIIVRDMGVVDADTRMMHLVMQIEDPYGIKTAQPPMKFGSYVEVQFTGKELNNVYKVPQTLVNNSAIWLVDEAEQLQSYDVNVIREEGSYFYIASGITEHARLAENLPEYPQNGMPVKIQAPDELLLSSTN